MAEIKADPRAEGCYHVVGELNFDTVPGVFEQGVEVLRRAPAVIEIDLGGVTRSDSAGLALLIEWMRVAHSHHKNISFGNIPAQMMAMAGISGLDRILPLAGAAAGARET